MIRNVGLRTVVISPIIIKYELIVTKSIFSWVVFYAVNKIFIVFLSFSFDLRNHYYGLIKGAPWIK